MRRGGIAAIAVLAVLSLGVGSASAACTKPHGYPVGSGKMPNGEVWKVRAHIKNNGSCDSWLFELAYRLGEFGNAGDATGIPPGGHVPREYFSLSANELQKPDSSERVFYGYTDRIGAKVVAKLTDGTSFELAPQLAPAKLRKRVDWLRSFRYFVYFRSSEIDIEQVSVFTRGGRLIYRSKSEEGSFW